MKSALKYLWPHTSSLQYRCTLGVEQLLLGLFAYMLEVVHLPLWDFL